MLLMHSFCTLHISILGHQKKINVIQGENQRYRSLEHTMIKQLEWQNDDNFSSEYLIIKVNLSELSYMRKSYVLGKSYI